MVLLAVSRVCLTYSDDAFLDYNVSKLLSDLDKTVRQWRRVNNAEGRMSEKLFLFFPQSCRCRDSIADESSLIKHRGHLPIITKDRAGIIERQYKNTIYSVTDDNGEVSVRIVSSNYIKKIVINSLLVENEIIQGFSLPYILLFTICALIKHRHLF